MSEPISIATCLAAFQVIRSIDNWLGENSDQNTLSEKLEKLEEKLEGMDGRTKAAKKLKSTIEDIEKAIKKKDASKAEILVDAALELLGSS